MTAQSPQGLTAEEASAKLTQFGPNEIRPSRTGFLGRIFHWLISPISLMLLAAAALSFFAGKDFDGYFILGLYLLNFSLGWWQEYRADRAVETLQRQLAAKVWVRRGGDWQEWEARLLVPGDWIRLTVGDLIPADLKIGQATNVTVNEAALTGESLPQERGVGVELYSGSFIVTGYLEGEVTATGLATKFGRTINLVESGGKRSLLEEDILSITKLLAGISLGAVATLTAILVYTHAELGEVLRLDLSLIIAGIPVSLPTVMTLIIGIGVLGLAKKSVIVRRFSSLENLANVNLLLSDKTGTLTENRVEIEEIEPYGNLTAAKVIELAVRTVPPEAKSPIDQAVLGKAKSMGLTPVAVRSFIPADSARKYASAVAEVQGVETYVAFGAPQVVRELAHVTGSEGAKLDRDLEGIAAQGFRAIAVAAGPDEKGLRLAGLILLSDTILPDAAEVLKFMAARGIRVLMLTGDNLVIARRVAGALGLAGEVISQKELEKVNLDELGKDWFTGKAGVAEIMPEGKFKLAKAAKKFYVVAVTGDGVNDLPALETADVGVAVASAVDALKSAADIVLLEEGLSRIKDAVIEARRIFARLYSYSVYRISESFRLIMTTVILGLLFLSYPLTPLQLILLAFLNDVPIITLAVNRVKDSPAPSSINSRARMERSLLFGTVGIANSVIFFFVATGFFHLPVAIVQTAFFLKMTVSGHMLLYLAHTTERWWRYLPSRPVIAATTLTQLLASLIAAVGVLMAPIPLWLIVFVWIWAFFWMQVGEVTKLFRFSRTARASLPIQSTGERRLERDGESL